MSLVLFCHGILILNVASVSILRVCVRVSVCARARVCVRACVRACVCVCVVVFVCFLPVSILFRFLLYITKGSKAQV